MQKTEAGNFVKSADKSKVIVGPAESMSKSKKNTIDPEVMINQYGADAVRWFIFLIVLLKRMFNGRILVFHLKQIFTENLEFKSINFKYERKKSNEK